MPIPKRESGEERNTFVSRCIKEMNNKETSMTQEQIVAACETQADMSMTIGYEEYIQRIRVRKVTLLNNDGSPDMRYKKNKSI